PIRIPSSANIPNAPPPPPPPGGGAPAPADPRADTDPNRVGGACGGMLTPGLISGRTMTMAQLANLFSRFLTRMVVDRTGLAGEFDVDLVYTPDQMPQQVGAFAPLSPPSDGPSIFTAVQEQLGLKLESTKGPVAVLVVERVEAPKEN
ncbi:MAG TPA: TIGR03435 family protein, partial [Vicinamibacterales bacterium]|nr:TIGR03435 family protein [Vicinamibacterales bacterium]